MKIPFPDKVTMDAVMVWIIHRIADERVERELAPLLAKEERPGLALKIRSSLNALAEHLRTWGRKPA